ncbi:RNA polymerase sigma factor [Sphaerotilus sp.]|uniref:RNA polymerase sigma factor n=1 Tax=Sphaerotilus sp. TaxID=2093942 RepID=UPI002ACD2719|nr:RNA polymerase sigma factor [Sphaerotilus sp.]MDZ7855801.1 RNA polymerase sigma factor [Sphaerotilus sp.]
MPTWFADCLAHYGELKRYLQRRLRNAEDAADLTQASFERVFVHAQAGPGQGSVVHNPRALLFGVARNLCVDMARRRAVEDEALRRLGAAPAEPAPSAEHESICRQAVTRLLDRLARMPHRRRDAFVLVRVLGCTHAEAAARLGSSVAAVEKNVVRAALDLRDLAGLQPGSDVAPARTLPSAPVTAECAA